MVRFFSILGFFLLYTVFEMARLWPAHALVAAALSVALFALMLGSPFILHSNGSVLDRPWFRVMAWTGSLSMAVWATFILLSIPVEIVAAVSAPIGGLGAPALERLRLAALLAAAVLAGVGFLQVLRGARLRRVNVRMPDLPPALRGLTIAHISDLHVGPTLRKGYVESVVGKVNRAAPDFIVFTGDLADAPAAAIAPSLEPLRNLRARRGKFFVTGNHEYYWGVDDIVAEARDLGFTPLLNENRRVAVDGAEVLVAGITDPQGERVDGHKPDMPRAAGAPPAKPALKILLSHRPGAHVEAASLGFDLQLSGHTHAGQFFPFSLLIGFFHKFSRGLYRDGRLWVYVNPGTGYWGPADRLGVAPEITVLTLR